MEWDLSPVWWFAKERGLGAPSISNTFPELLGRPEGIAEDYNQLKAAESESEFGSVCILTPCERVLRLPAIVVLFGI